MPSLTWRTSCLVEIFHIKILASENFRKYFGKERKFQEKNIFNFSRFKMFAEVRIYELIFKFVLEQALM